VVYPLTYRQITYNPFWPDRSGGFRPALHPNWHTATAASWWVPRGLKPTWLFDTWRPAVRG
jgi:hypothetical protein